MVDTAEYSARSRGTLITALLAALLVGPTPAHAENPSADDSPVKIDISWELNGGTPLASLLNEEFTLPEDCPRLVRSAAVNGNWLDTSSRRVLVGSLAFCRRSHLMERGFESAQLDFVSEEDFSSLSLGLIPPLVLLRGGHSKWSHDLTERAIDRAQVACGGRSPCPHYSWAGVDATWDLPSRRSSEPVEEVDAESCHLHGGRFTGEVELKDGTIHCVWDPTENGVALREVSFRDVNRDGTMDAILSVIEVRDGGSNPYPQDEFVLTRRTADGPLEPVDVGEDEHRPWR